MAASECDGQAVTTSKKKTPRPVRTLAPSRPPPAWSARSRAHRRSGPRRRRAMPARPARRSIAPPRLPRCASSTGHQGPHRSPTTSTRSRWTARLEPPVGRPWPLMACDSAPLWHPSGRESAWEGTRVGGNPSGRGRQGQRLTEAVSSASTRCRWRSHHGPGCLAGRLRIALSRRLGHACGPVSANERCAT